ncbi:MAG TPA: hypothetical protein VMH24_01390 [Candidatus Sulfotelmatobacter sp.]|nr:hypothetical protein [Candidatus Sulfotelmatobacter sp.]
MRLPRKRWLVVALVLGALAVIDVAQDSVIGTGDTLGYLTTGARSLTVRVTVAPCSWTRVADVAEATTTVRVTIRTWPCPQVGPSTMDLGFRDVPVTLQSDLGTRTVQDADGQPIGPLTAPADQVADTGDGFGGWLETEALVAIFPPTLIVLLLWWSWNRRRPAG